MQTRRTIPILVLALVFSCFADIVSAQDIAAATTDVATQAKEVTANFAQLISQAYNGSVEARESLLKDYLANSLLLIAALVISYVIASAIGRFVGGLVSSRVDQTMGKFLSKAVRNLIMIVVAMVVLESRGISVASFAAVLAALGFAIGLALQGTLSNFAAGVMLLVFRPFKVDDFIVVAGVEGQVEEIDLFTTRINTNDNRHIIIPNSEIFGNKLENYTRNSVRRVDVNVGTAYAADLKVTRAALERAVNSVAIDTKHGKPEVYLVQLGSSSVDWQLRVWDHPKNYWQVRERLTVAAKYSLDQAGVGIPYPQMDVHVVGKLLAKAA